MKKSLFIAVFTASLAAAGSIQAQHSRANGDPDGDGWKINVLKAPASPGANLIGISPTSIQKPSDPTAFAVSLLSSTDNLSTIPNSYAVDFAPAWLFRGQYITYEQFTNDKNIWNNIRQTFVTSFAFKNVKDSVADVTNTRIGLGFRLSLKRGKIKDNTLDKIKSTSNYLSKYTKLRTDYQNEVQAQTNLDSATRKKALRQADAEARNDAKGYLDSIKSIVESLDFSRTGLVIDLAGGFSYAFLNQANGKLANAGAWLTAGYQGKRGLDALGIVRFLHNPDLSAAQVNAKAAQPDYHTLDFGGRLLYGAPGNRFTFGAELVYRDISDNPDIKSSWRYALNTDYQVGKNQVVSFSIGRDFDGTVNKGGNLLAALNFIVGFGSNRPVSK
ncbi:hypothetical protein AAFN85_13670 [Mucilaginibacter sp. CAU 1740]|uniref:hypothetical protein n=1 Tax=Mucilaginibacter sp. CAU 1740 TaxID=3140365 RepID=UPI00325B99D3